MVYFLDSPIHLNSFARLDSPFVTALETDETLSFLIVNDWCALDTFSVAALRALGQVFFNVHCFTSFSGF
jgi:hypothetical protein